MKIPQPVTCFIILMAFLSVSCSYSREEKVPLSFEDKKSVLEKHSISSSDGHPLILWGKRPKNSKGIILGLHGRTWSSLPLYDLQIVGEDLSIMDELNRRGYTVYALDLRGYGATKRDDSGWNTLAKSTEDILKTCEWIVT